MRGRCHLNRWLLRRAFAGAPTSVRVQRFIWREVSRCPDCRATFDLLARAERLLASGGADVRTPVAAEFAPFADSVVDTALGEEHGKARSRWVFAAVVSAPVAALAMLMMVLWSPARIEHPTSVGESPYLARHQARSAVSLRILCETPGPDGVEVRSLSETPGPQEMQACPSQGTFVFAYVASQPVSVSAVVEGPDGDLRVLAQDVAVEAASNLSPLPFNVSAATLEGRAEARVWVWFSTDEVYERVLRVGPSGTK